MSFSDDEILAALLRVKDRNNARRRHDNIVVGSLVGRRLQLVATDRADPPLANGAEGSVRSVGDNGRLLVDWDGSWSFYQLDPAVDRWEWLGPPPPTTRFPDGLILDALLRTKRRDRSRRHVDKRVIASLRGRRVRLDFTNDQYTDLEPGDEGWVRDIDDAGTVFVRWDRVVGVGMIPGSDRWTWL